MDKAEVRSVQRLTLEVQSIEQLSVNAFSAPVDRVADQRMANRSQVHPDLMGPARLQPAFDQRRVLKQL